MNTEVFCSTAGRRILVTGSGRGIGRAAALCLARGGGEVIFHASAMNDTLKSALAEAKAEGLNARAAAADLKDPEEIKRLVRETGPVDVLVLNASVQKYMTLPEYDEEELRRTYQVNVAASFRLIQAYLPGMIARNWGRVIALGSVNQWKPSARLLVYASSKAAQANLMTALAREYAGKGITFNSIAPGIIATDRNKEELSKPESRAKLAALIPAGFFGKAEDCAGIIRLLASDAGRYINGADIPVAGGMQI